VHLAQFLIRWILHWSFLALRFARWIGKHLWNYASGCRGWQKLVYVVIPCVFGLSVSKGADIAFYDAAFLAVSGVTGTGLVTKNLSSLPPVVTFVMLVLSVFVRVLPIAPCAHMLSLLRDRTSFSLSFT
jgi:hypothetical protein